MEIEFEPDLSHCIQTLAKEEYDRLLMEILKTEQSNSEINQSLEMLRAFLESTDFPKLRGEYEPYLVEGKRVRFTLSPMADDVEYRFEVT
ncbi:MAG: hypothetical protein HOC20_06975 [Chloroflexi bacterium]|jgi:hypothetical protein|nr:hypothetical protein [Chloroflexota bacterium]